MMIDVIVGCFRYGENGTISLAGLKRLLQNVGLDRIRTVTVQHHEQPGHHEHHHHHHPHHHHEGHHHQKHVHADPSHPRKVPKSPEVSKDQDRHPILQRGTTAAYSAQLLVKPDEDKRRDGRPETTGASVNRLVTESQIQAGLVDHDDHHQDHINQDLPHNQSADSAEVQY